MQLIEPVYDSYNNTGAMSEQGDSSSAEEVESPRSVVTAAVARKSGGKEKSYLHSQVLRVKEEELQIGEYLKGGFGIYNINYVPDSIPLVVVDDLDASTKMVLPASPLGSKKNNC
uniref:Uncharacterized protein n=1 Tax=Chenopodium quinoa TaxID=63459 RepID=A0A803N3H8_CHEQI